mgnify:CR=1 FL=1
MRRHSSVNVVFGNKHLLSHNLTLYQFFRNVICLLEMQCEDVAMETGDTTLHIALDDLRMTWAAMQIGQRGILDRMPLTDIEVRVWFE